LCWRKYKSTNGIITRRFRRVSCGIFVTYILCIILYLQQSQRTLASQRNEEEATNLHYVYIILFLSYLTRTRNRYGVTLQQYITARKNILYTGRKLQTNYVIRTICYSRYTYTTYYINLYTYMTHVLYDVSKYIYIYVNNVQFRADYRIASSKYSNVSYCSLDLY